MIVQKKLMSNSFAYLALCAVFSLSSQQTVLVQHNNLFDDVITKIEDNAQIELEDGSSQFISTSLVAQSPYLQAKIENTDDPELPRISLNGSHIKHLRATKDCMGLRDVIAILECLQKNNHTEARLQAKLGNLRTATYLVNALKIAQEFQLKPFQTTLEEYIAHELRYGNFNDYSAFPFELQKKLTHVWIKEFHGTQELLTLQSTKFFLKASWPIENCSKKSAWSTDGNLFAYVSVKPEYFSAAGKYSLTVCMFDTLTEENEQTTFAFRTDIIPSVLCVTWSPDNGSIGILLRDYSQQPSKMLIYLFDMNKRALRYIATKECSSKSTYALTWSTDSQCVCVLTSNPPQNPQFIGEYYFHINSKQPEEFFSITHYWGDTITLAWNGTVFVFPLKLQSNRYSSTGNFFAIPKNNTMNVYSIDPSCFELTFKQCETLKQIWNQEQVIKPESDVVQSLPLLWKELLQKKLKEQPFIKKQQNASCMPPALGCIIQ